MRRFIDLQVALNDTDVERTVRAKDAPSLETEPDQLHIGLMPRGQVLSGKEVQRSLFMIVTVCICCISNLLWNKCV